MKKYISEMLGTMILVLFGTGVATLSGGDLLATSLAFGLSIVVCACLFGNISGAHVNPCVSFAKYMRKELTSKDFCFYTLFQVIGALLGSLILYIILKTSNMGVSSLGANGYGVLSACDISAFGAFITEVILTFVFISAVLAAGKKEYKDISGIIIGLALTFVHLLGINLTGTSVNPARSLAPAVILGGTALKQVWIFIIAPFVGAMLSCITYKALNKK